MFVLNFCSLVVEILLHSPSPDYLIRTDTLVVHVTHPLVCNKHQRLTFFSFKTEKNLVMHLVLLLVKPFCPAGLIDPFLPKNMGTKWAWASCCIFLSGSCLLSQWRELGCWSGCHLGALLHLKV